jgi:polyhydroxybutyrate depolymerase
MKRALRLVLWSLIAIVAMFVALFGYFVYSPAPEVPRLSGKLTRGILEVGGRKRTYSTYLPRGWKRGPLVVVMHGSGENGARIRRTTGYGFDRLADEQGFAVVYPDAYQGNWNACNVVGNYSANQLGIDDVEFLTGIADKLITEIDVDRDRVFATGVSRGGQMAYRLAFEAPSRFRAVAAVAASVPVPENFKCKPTGQGTSSVLIMNGTKDPINPFEGGEVKLFGYFLRRGKVRSARGSGQYLADLNHIPGPPATQEMPGIGEDHVEQMLWRNGSNVEVELIAIHGGGHGLPQPYTRYPRLLGPTPKEPNGPAVIWAFFERQKPG